MKHLATLTILAMLTQLIMAQNNDPYLWLEGVDDDKALEWVEEWNKKSLATLTSQPGYENTYGKNLEILNSDDRIADPTIRGSYIYNFWQDKTYQRGIWRRATTKSYLDGNPDWEILLNIDELSEKDGEKWVFKGATGLYPDYNKFLVNLSKGGGDAVLIKEFDARTKSFEENGFTLPEAKGGASWIDENTLMVSTDFGDGVTTSGYPKQVRIWKRGTNLNDAKEIFNGNENDMGIWGYTQHTRDRVYQVIMRRTSFYEGEYYFLENGELLKPELPEDIELNTFFNGQVIFQLKSDWKVNSQTFPQGAVISIEYDDLLAEKKNFELVVEPGERISITGISDTKDCLLVNMLNNVKSELFAFRYNGKWIKEKIDAPDFGNISLGSSDQFSNHYFFYFQNFLEPSTLYFGDAETGKFSKVKSLSSWFPTEKYQVKQFEAVSKDGTPIPYFVVHAKSIRFDGTNPTLLYAYGGFEIPQLPRYSALTGTAWLEKGGVYVLANLRGGGEFGPQWHQAGLKENRQRVFDDFHAIAENLISKKITSPKKLGIYGGSNGGLLVGVAFTQRPDLYGAVVCAVPLLDMKRYNKLLAGASWMAEYGNPDVPEEWEYIRKYSPYHNLKEGMNYPEVFFTTSTRDDRVHPGHARKMVAKMHDMGYKIYYFENTEGGHAGASTNEQRAKMYALLYSYLQMKLMDN
ncbi:S9 family peptidase [Mariniphaga sediminis]|uniref:S9 family peptidase n=1 Tax=Mariniphaga sediminis TaxID=1628158 RepID=A0A399DAK1_9BACT|nr:prolyl oligopeptidase family serine peptidase [Mariniphaga sediminis]RIH67171.1 S9 family peptidase [Mariniphaga sediminis]